MFDCKTWPRSCSVEHMISSGTRGEASGNDGRGTSEIFCRIILTAYSLSIVRCSVEWGLGIRLSKGLPSLCQRVSIAFQGPHTLLSYCSFLLFLLVTVLEILFSAPVTCDARRIPKSLLWGPSGVIGIWIYMLGLGREGDERKGQWEKGCKDSVEWSHSGNSLPVAGYY